jgi:hypothetical protein
MVRVAVSAIAVLCGAFSSAQAAGVAFQTGDVLAGIGNGTIKHFRFNGLGQIVLVDVLSTGVGGEDTGMAFDAAGNLYATTFEANNLFKFDNKGNLIGAFGSGYNRDPESIVFDKAGNMYVGQADGLRQVLKFGPNGILLDTYNLQRDDRGTDWIDLAADQCTLHYTSEGDSIKAFNICTKAQLPDFAGGLSGPCYGHRIRPNAEELVACTSQVYRLDGTGTVIQTYRLPGTSLLFALNLDPDNKSFWTADYFRGTVFRIDIATGVIATQFNAGVLQTLAGLTVVGEITAATTAPLASTSYYVKTTDSTILNAAGRDLAVSQIAAGANQDSVVALLFGAPTFKDNVYGVTGFSDPPIPLSTVESLVQAFVIGYYHALGSNTSLHVRVAIATSNSTTQCGGSYVTREHGQAWAQMINRVASWVVSHDEGGQVVSYARQVDIAGGSDMETDGATDRWASCNPGPKWASAAETIAWVDGYSSVLPRRFLYDVGDANGCNDSLPLTPQTAAPIKCQGDWDQEKVWTIAWGKAPSEPLPQIYFEHMAIGWVNLSLYGVLAHNGAIIIAGTLTEFAQDADTYTPVEGWLQLYHKLQGTGNTATAQTPPWSTDISCLGSAC